MTNQQKPKRHHFVPECYLKNFIVKGNLFTLNIEDVKKGYNVHLRKNQPSKICYYEDYYKIESDLTDEHFKLGEYDDLFIEKEVLRKLEGRYGSLFQRLSSKDDLLFKDAADLADFIIQLKLRNPYWLNKTISEKKDNWIDSSIENITNQIKDNELFMNISDDNKRAAIKLIQEKCKSDPTYSKKIQLSSLINRFISETESNKVLKESILRSDWIVMESPSEGPFFITSDNPGFSVNSNTDKIFNTRFTDGFAFHFPLSPRFCLLITDIEMDDKAILEKAIKRVDSVQVTNNMVLEINYRTIQCINKLLIASDEWYLTQIADIQFKDIYKMK